MVQSVRSIEQFDCRCRWCLWLWYSHWFALACVRSFRLPEKYTYFTRLSCIRFVFEYFVHRYKCERWIIWRFCLFFSVVRVCVLDTERGIFVARRAWTNAFVGNRPRVSATEYDNMYFVLRESTVHWRIDAVTTQQQQHTISIIIYYDIRAFCFVASNARLMHIESHSLSQFVDLRESREKEPKTSNNEK